MIDNIKSFAKFLDQPLLIAHLNKNMPKIMLTGTALYSAKKGYDIFESDKNFTSFGNKDKTKNYLKNTGILFSSVICALIAPKLASQITRRPPLETLMTVKKQNSKLVEEFVLKNKNSLSEENLKVLEHAKTNILSLSQIKKLMKDLKEKKLDGFMKKLIPNPENISSKDIFPK